MIIFHPLPISTSCDHFFQQIFPLHYNVPQFERTRWIRQSINNGTIPLRLWITLLLKSFCLGKFRLPTYNYKAFESLSKLFTLLSWRKIFVSKLGSDNIMIKKKRPTHLITFERDRENEGGDGEKSQFPFFFLHWNGMLITSIIKLGFWLCFFFKSQKKNHYFYTYEYYQKVLLVYFKIKLFFFLTIIIIRYISSLRRWCFLFRIRYKLFLKEYEDILVIYTSTSTFMV